MPVNADNAIKLSVFGPINFEIFLKKFELIFLILKPKPNYFTAFWKAKAKKSLKTLGKYQLIQRFCKNGKSSRKKQNLWVNKEFLVKNAGKRFRHRFFPEWRAHFG